MHCFEYYFILTSECHESQTRLLTLIIPGLLTSGKLQRVDKMADESRGANTKHRVKQWALIRTESNTYYHDSENTAKWLNAQDKRGLQGYIQSKVPNNYTVPSVQQSENTIIT